MPRRNTYKEDELLEEPFNIKHLLRAFVYIKKHGAKMITALIVSALGGAAALFGAGGCRRHPALYLASLSIPPTWRKPIGLTTFSGAG